MADTLVQLVIILIICTCSSRADPQACTYISTEWKYECNAQSWALPLDIADFNNTPQVLSLYNIDGELATSPPNGPTFRDFNLIDTSSFASSVVPKLIITCVATGELIMWAGTFAGLSYIKELYFIDCNVLNLADGVFTTIQDLNLMSFEGGSISSISNNAFSGIDIYPMDVRNPSGTLSIRNSKLTSYGLPNGVFIALTNLAYIVIDNVNASSLQADMFAYNKKLRSITLNNNPFSSIQSTFFDGMTSLSGVEMYGIDWDCSCANLWFLAYSAANNITLYGDFVCNTPAAYTGKHARTYYTEQCTTIVICKDIAGVDFNGECMTYVDIANYTVFPLTVIFSTLAFMLTFHFKRTEMDGVKERIQGGVLPSPPPPYTERPVSGSKWNKVAVAGDDVVEPGNLTPPNDGEIFNVVKQEDGNAAVDEKYSEEPEKHEDHV